MQHFPRGEHFVVTTMFDDKNRVVQWYIDICKTQGLTDQQVPWLMICTWMSWSFRRGRVFLLDEDELEEAVDEGRGNEQGCRVGPQDGRKVLSTIRNGRFRYFTLSLKHRKTLAAKWEKLSES